MDVSWKRRFTAIQGTANAKTWPVEDTIRTRSKEQGAESREQGAGSREQEVEKLISDSRPRHWGRLPPVVERALSLYACHGRDGSGIARRREGFWFRVQRSEDRGQSAEGRGQQLAEYEYE